MQDAILLGNGRQYVLHGWVVMPTHVHTLLTPIDTSLSRIMQSIKGYSSKEIQKKIGGPQTLWQPEYFDWWIRDEKLFSRVLSYIEWNPVKAHLCEDPKHWPYSSANEFAWKLSKADGTSL